MPEHAPRRLVTFTRADGKSFGRAYLDQCEEWIQTKFGGSSIGQEIWDLYQSNPEAWEGEPPPPPMPTNPIGTWQFHHGNIEPTLYHSPQGEWFRRLWWHEYSGGGLDGENRRYVGMTTEQAHAWLKFNGYKLREDSHPQAGLAEHPIPRPSIETIEGKVPLLGDLGQTVQPSQAVIEQESCGEVMSRDDSPKPTLRVASRATAAAYELHKSGKRVSVVAVAKLAGVDRSYLYKSHPEVIKLIQTLATPDRHKPRGTKDRYGNLEAEDDSDE